MRDAILFCCLLIGSAAGCRTGLELSEACVLPDCEPAPEPCEDHGADLTCEADGRCRSVFVDHDDCRCDAPGCCARFDRCVALESLTCAPLGDWPDPSCPPFFGCPAGWDTTYEAFCAVGCVRHPACEIAEGRGG